MQDTSDMQREAVIQPLERLEPDPEPTTTSTSTGTSMEEEPQREEGENGGNNAGAFIDEDGYVHGDLNQTEEGLEGEEMEDDEVDEEMDNGEGTARIFFIIMPDGYTKVQHLPRSLTVREIRGMLSDDIKFPMQEINLLIDGKLLEDAYSLAEYGVQADVKTEMEVQLGVLEVPEEEEEEDEFESREQGLRENAAPIYVDDSAYDFSYTTEDDYVMPDVFPVEVHYGPQIPSKIVRVQVHQFEGTKPFLGGWRHKHTQVEFHNASAQTPRSEADIMKRQKALSIQKAHRSTQTPTLVTRSQQTTREQGTQMAKPGLYVEDRNDVIVVTGEYFSADEVHNVKVDACITVQKYLRGYFARKRARQLLDERREEYEEEMQKGKEEALEREARRRKEIERRMHPKTKEDFELLYSELEAWRLQETRNIQENPELEEDERKQLMHELLSKETKLLQTIDRLKITASKQNKESSINKRLEMMAAPKQWQLNDGSVVDVDTQFTTRARELLDLYNRLQMKLLTVDERLDVLLHVKWTVKEFDCNLTRDIVELIDREFDLLDRGRSEKSLEKQRKRLSNLFLQFCETPEFNPEAARFQVIPYTLVKRQTIKPIQSRASSRVASSSSSRR
eukprot:TRINITY_DN1470_c0_g1_i6.p1 TRINITY_DN1470_c0_g1~~TRINITY_DN1470_c0_g1_i6.p1  ORF type:complete len:621 (+),score=217.31 TRINITY_DN1470_c0_g1_i6:52-1914(+)